MEENRRDAGLLRAVGTWGFAASTINAVIGASIFVVPATLAASLGAYAPLALLACAIAIGAIAICFAEGGSRVPTSGGAYGYIEAAFGPMAGYVAGTVLWFSNLLASSGIAAALADTVVTILPPRWTNVAHAGLIIAVIAGIALVNLTGTARGAQLINASTLLKLIPLAVFLLAGASAFQRTKFFQGVTPTTTGLGPAVILALFAFTGMEVSVCASGEVAQPARTIPRGLLMAMLVLTLLYVSIQIIAQGMLGSALGYSAVPLADAMAPISPALRLLMLAGAALSMFGFISTDMLCSPRILLALSRDGLLPRALGKVNRGTHTPNAAIPLPRCAGHRPLTERVIRRTGSVVNARLCNLVYRWLCGGFAPRTLWSRVGRRPLEFPLAGRSRFYRYRQHAGPYCPGVPHRNSRHVRTHRPKRRRLLGANPRGPLNTPSAALTVREGAVRDCHSR